MSKTDYRELMDKSFLGAWDVPLTGDLILTIDKVTKETVTLDGGKKEDHMLIHYKEVEKPMICNVINGQTIAQLANSNYIEDWPGMRIALYAKSGIKVGTKVKDGLRIRETLPKLPDKLVCASCGNPVVAHGGYNAATIAEQSRGAYGKILCWECAKKAKEAADQKAKESDVL